MIRCEAPCSHGDHGPCGEPAVILLGKVPETEGPVFFAYCAKDANDYLRALLVERDA